jgi:hypothetical protein
MVKASATRRSRYVGVPMLGLGVLCSVVCGGCAAALAAALAAAPAAAPAVMPAAAPAVAPAAAPAVAPAAAPAVAPAPTGFTPYSYFRSLAPAGLARLQVRLTYLGPRIREFPSVAFSLPGDTLDMQLARFYRRTGFDYGAHPRGLITCRITPQELKAAIDSIATLADVTDGDVDSLALFSFALVDTAGGSPRCFEAILNEASGLGLVERMGAALKGNGRAASVLAGIGCGLKLVPSDPPGEVTGLVAAMLGGFTFDATTRRVGCRLRVLNVSGDSIPGPLVVVLKTRPGSVTVLDADGSTCRVYDPGCPYVLLPLERALAPGAAVERLVQFGNPRQVSFEVLRRVFVGVAER